jgi:hypothetical protein
MFRICTQIVCEFEFEFAEIFEFESVPWGTRPPAEVDKNFILGDSVSMDYLGMI